MISYPLSLPTSIGIESIELRAVNAVATSQSPFTYKQQIVAHQGQRWEASVTLPPLRRDLMAPWKAFLTSLKGQQGTFLLGDPDYATPQGNLGTSTPVANGNQFSNSNTLDVSGFDISTTGVLLAGDYIQLGTGSSSRLYQVLQDVDSDGSGEATLDIWPNLRTDVPDGFSVITASPKGLFRLATNISSWSVNNSNAYGIQFEAVEALI